MNDIKQGEVNLLKHLVGIEKTKKARESINGHNSLHNDLKSTAYHRLDFLQLAT